MLVIRREEKRKETGIVRMKKVITCTSRLRSLHSSGEGMEYSVALTS